MRRSDFVYKHYQPGRLDTQAALRKVRARCGLDGRSRRWRWVAVAASLLLMVSVGGWFLAGERETVISTAGSVRRVSLPDGSRVTLSPHSEVSYSGDCRQLVMRGKAYFEVRHDSLRPFTVTGSRGMITVLGTKFMLDESRADRSQVCITGGAVFYAATATRHGIVLRQGQSATLPAHADRPVPDAEPDVNGAAWATGQFRFVNASMRHVLHVLGDYYHVRLTCSDESRRLTADFSTASLPAIIRLIEESLDVEVRRVDGQ